MCFPLNYEIKLLGPTGGVVGYLLNIIVTCAIGGVTAFYFEMTIIDGWMKWGFTHDCAQQGFCKPQ